ncbi:hypothetical protein [Duganella sp. FT27W]|uniref:hypothetical protein n=1 Tax=Duganella sp. FT27W TaxID=2654636 RepID=UPI00128DFBD5|nr:hypothetical protein [Duganella sp. FT27W]MPQ56553.1 hypothetical protein [Duganella sp. FT27W]
MEEIASYEGYELNEPQNSQLIALARSRNEPPQNLVREAVEKYLVDVAYDTRRDAIFAALKHPQRDHSVFGAWKGANVDGVAYQNALRNE